MKLLLACAAIVLVGASFADAQDTTLRYRWVKGDQVRYRITQQMNLRMSVLPEKAEMTMDQNSVQVVRMTVEDVAADGSATVRQTFESIRMQISAQGRTFFDSAAADQSADPIAATMKMVMSAMVGESIKLVLSPNGTVLKVEGMSRIFDKVAISQSQDPIPALMLGELRTEMRRSFEQGFAIFPDRAVSTGETWTGEFEMDLGGGILAARTSTLKGVEQINGTSMARMAVTLAMRLAPDAAPPAAVAELVEKIGDAKGEGEVLFDVIKGRVQKTSFTVDIPITTSREALGLGAGSLNRLTKSTMTMEIVEA